jgi:hypothetical protein
MHTEKGLDLEHFHDFREPRMRVWWRELQLASAF